jgi:Homeodomain-like domain
MRFVLRLKDRETMASLCREFGISRKTGYKIFERYEKCGREGLSDRTRRPFRFAKQLPEQREAAIVAARRERPNWGARKIRERLLRLQCQPAAQNLRKRVDALRARNCLAPQSGHVSNFCGPTRGVIEPVNE